MDNSKAFVVFTVSPSAASKRNSPIFVLAIGSRIEGSSKSRPSFRRITDNSLIESVRIRPIFNKGVNFEESGTSDSNNGLMSAPVAARPAAKRRCRFMIPSSRSRSFPVIKRSSSTFRLGGSKNKQFSGGGYRFNNSSLSASEIPLLMLLLQHEAITEWRVGAKTRFSFRLSATSDNIADGRGRSTVVVGIGGSADGGPGNALSGVDECCWIWLGVGERERL